MIKKMKQKVYFCLFLLTIFSSIKGFSAEKQPEILVNNRILATVNGKTISVMDVMKKMDLFLSKSYPEYSKSNMHRFQFFNQNWRSSLNQLIDHELIIADKERVDMKISDSEIREKIHERFGPNVMASLDILGVTFDEAWDAIYAEMAVQRMSWYRVHSKAISRASPQNIKTAYQQFLLKNPPKEEWKYQVISIRGKTDALGKIYAQKAQALIQNEPLSFEALAQKLKEEKDSSITVQVSEEYAVEKKDLSDSHKAVLCNLNPNTYSAPIAQMSRDQSTVHRIFYLKEHKISPPPSFGSMVDTLQDEILQKEVEKELPLYLAKLRKQFNFDEKSLDSIPIDFQPFYLK